MKTLQTHAWRFPWFLAWRTWTYVISVCVLVQQASHCSEIQMVTLQGSWNHIVISCRFKEFALSHSEKHFQFPFPHFFHFSPSQSLSSSCRNWISNKNSCRDWSLHYQAPASRTDFVYLWFNSGSLEVKLPTVWTDGKAEVGRVRETEKEKIREGKEPEERRCRCARR